MDEWRPVLPTAEKIKSQKGFLIVLGLLGAAIVAGTWAQSGTPALGIMIVVAGTGFMSLVMHRRVRIEINRQGLRIRGGGSRTFGWGEIAEITTAPSTLLGGDTCWPAVWIVTTDGERIQTKAVRWDQ